MDVEKREIAFDLYKNSDGKKPLKDIAKEVEASPGTVRGWKSRYRWDELIGKIPLSKECNATKKKRNVTRNATLQPIIDNDKLNEQQKMFCLYYLKSFNATKAYQEAYQADYKTANVNGSRLLVNASVKEELRRLKAELQQEVFIDTKDLINEYSKQAFADITDFTDFGTEIVETADGREIECSFVRLKPSAEIDGRLIQEIKQGREGTTVKFHDKQKAMQELKKYFDDTEEEKRTSRVIITRGDVTDG